MIPASPDSTLPIDGLYMEIMGGSLSYLKDLGILFS
jgi:hypothetical protein